MLVDMDNRLSSLTRDEYKNLQVKDFVRCIGAISSKEPGVTPAQVFAQRFPASPHRSYVEAAMHKAIVPAATTTNDIWAGTLVPNLSMAFAAAALPFSLIGRFGSEGAPPLTRAPFNAPTAFADPTSLGSMVQWIENGAPKPLISASVDRFTLRRATAAFIVVLTDEVARFAAPGGEEFLQRQLALALGFGLDRLFIDESIAATTSTPAAITNGASAAATSTGDAGSDLLELLQAFRVGGGWFASAVILISSANATALALRSGANGIPVFPGLSVRGGTLAGLPCLASDAVGDRLIIVDTSRVLLADDLELDISRATSATLQMLDNPTNHAGTGTATTMVSMFHTNSVAVRLERFINWQVTDEAAVQWVDGVDYLTEGSPGSPA